MRIPGWIIAGGIAAFVATASGATGPGSDRQSCGQEEELVAAKRALQSGDREAALRHLKNADALLERCIRDGTSVPAQDDSEVVETRTG